MPAQAVCASCNGKIEGKFVTACGKNWHKNHFACCICERIVVEQFLESDDKVYCLEHYVEFVLPKCSHCSEPILEDDFLTLEDLHWHEHHFLCNVCEKPLDDDEEYETHEGKLLCELHYAIAAKDLCHTCGEPCLLSDDNIRLLGKVFHCGDCFQCYFCKDPIGDNAKFPHHDEVACRNCFRAKPPHPNPPPPPPPEPEPEPEPPEPEKPVVPQQLPAISEDAVSDSNLPPSDPHSVPQDSAVAVRQGRTLSILEEQADRAFGLETQMSEQSSQRAQLEGDNAALREEVAILKKELESMTSQRNVLRKAMEASNLSKDSKSSDSQGVSGEQYFSAKMAAAFQWHRVVHASQVQTLRISLATQKEQAAKSTLRIAELEKQLADNLHLRQTTLAPAAAAAPPPPPPPPPAAAPPPPPPPPKLKPLGAASPSAKTPALKKTDGPSSSTPSAPTPISGGMLSAVKLKKVERRGTACASVVAGGSTMGGLTNNNMLMQAMRSALASKFKQAVEDDSSWD